VRERLFSGIQPSGEIHIGNYLGALKNWVRLKDEYESIFCVVDYHAITIEYDVGNMRDRILDTAAILIAVGLDPDTCTIFVQSHVPQHTELAWIMGTLAPLGHLERMTQFKDKAEQHADNVNLGLFAYPVLQTADIILYKTDVVPVGEDQVQHLELCRELTRRFNGRYGNVFPEAKEIIGKGARIMSLDDPTKKMSKSLPEGCLFLTDPPEVIRAKLKVAVTDPQRVRRTDPGNPDVCNVFWLHELFTEEEERSRLAHSCRTAKIGCIECKKALADRIATELTPIREKYDELIAKPDYLWDVLAQGQRTCTAIAETTMQEVRAAMGL